MEDRSSRRVRTASLRKANRLAVKSPPIRDGPVTFPPGSSAQVPCRGVGHMDNDNRAAARQLFRFACANRTHGNDDINLVLYKGSNYFI